MTYSIGVWQKAYAYIRQLANKVNSLWLSTFSNKSLKEEAMEYSVVSYKDIQHTGIP